MASRALHHHHRLRDANNLIFGRANPDGREFDKEGVSYIELKEDESLAEGAGRLGEERIEFMMQDGKGVCESGVVKNW